MHNFVTLSTVGSSILKEWFAANILSLLSNLVKNISRALKQISELWGIDGK